MKLSNVVGVAIITATLAFSFHRTILYVGGFWNAAAVWMYAGIALVLVLFGRSLIDRE